MTEESMADVVGKMFYEKAMKSGMRWGQGSYDSEKNVEKCSECGGSNAPNVARCQYCGFWFKPEFKPKSIDERVDQQNYVYERSMTAPVYSRSKTTAMLQNIFGLAASLLVVSLIGVTNTTGKMQALFLQAMEVACVFFTIAIFLALLAHFYVNGVGSALNTPDTPDSTDGVSQQ